MFERDLIFVARPLALLMKLWGGMRVRIAWHPDGFQFFDDRRSIFLIGNAKPFSIAMQDFDFCGVVFQEMRDYFGDGEFGSGVVAISA